MNSELRESVKDMAVGEDSRRRDNSLKEGNSCLTSHVKAFVKDQPSARNASDGAAVRIARRPPLRPHVPARLLPAMPWSALFQALLFFFAAFMGMFFALVWRSYVRLPTDCRH